MIGRRERMKIIVDPDRSWFVAEGDRCIEAGGDLGVLATKMHQDLTGCSGFQEQIKNMNRSPALELDSMCAKMDTFHALCT